jgi:hypothetical protein
MRVLPVILISSGAIVSIAGIGIYYYYKKEVKLLKEFKYKVTYFNIGNISAEETTCYLTVRIYNSSTLSAEIKDFILDAYVDNKKLGRVEKSDKPNIIAGVYSDKSITDKLIIPAKGYSDAYFKVTFSPKLVLGAAAEVAIRYITTNDFTIDLRGYIEGKSGFISATVAMDYSTTFKEIMSPQK